MKSIRKLGNVNQAAVLLPVLIIAVVSFAVYANALQNGFIYDDHSQVLKNPLIRDITNIPEIFRRSAWTFEGAPPTSNYYRPMGNLLYMVAYHISGLHPWGYHLVNILFHVANSVLVFFIAARLLGEGAVSGQRSAVSAHNSPQPPLNFSPQRIRLSAERGGAAGGGVTFTIHPPKADPPVAGDSRFPAFIAALLFATHPIHTEAVTWIGGLPDVSFAFFYLLSLYLYVHSEETYGWWYVLSVVFFLLSTLCKEPGLTLPVVLIAYDYALGKKPVGSFSLIKRYAPYFLAAAFYFTVRYYVLGGFAPLKHVVRLSTYEYVINTFPLFGKYLYKLLLPLDLNFWPVFNPISSLLSEEGILSLFVTAAFAGLTILALKKSKVLFFSVLLIVMPLAPAFYLKGVIGKPFADRYLYLPSFGFVMLAAVLFLWVTTKYPGASMRLLAVFVLITGTYSAGTISRNSVWKDEYTLFADTVSKSPDSVVPRMELGNAFLARGRFDEAIEQYQAAMRMEPNLYVLHHHIGLALAGKNRLYEAVEQYQIAVGLNPFAPDTRVDLGRAYAKSGLLDAAIEQFQGAVELQPNAFNHNLLGIAYSQKGLRDKAIEQFKVANYLDPSETRYLRNLDEAIKMGKSSAQNIERRPDFGKKYEGISGTASDIVNFAW